MILIGIPAPPLCHASGPHTSDAFDLVIIATSCDSLMRIRFADYGHALIDTASCIL